MGVQPVGLSDSRDSFSRQEVRKMLRAWRFTERLGQHPLAQLLIVAARRSASGYPDSPVGYGLALREVVQNAVETLRPEDGEPAPGDKRWRPFLIVSQQYFQDRSPTSVACELGIERDTYNHSQARAIDLLIDVLRQQEELQHTTQTVAPLEPINPVYYGPMPATPLIGRDDDCEQVRDQLVSRHIRLITLTGAPGIGKTHLAMQVAANLSDAFADGIWWVSLAAIHEPERVVATIAQTIGVASNADHVAEAALTEYVRTKQMLLVLDNFEHVIDAAQLVCNLLAACPQLKVLVTSRVRLQVRGEHIVVVPALELPPLSTYDAIRQSSAVSLFIQRGQTANPAFELTAVNAPIVAEICAMLEGIPLAIELAAAQLVVFPPQEIVVRLQQRLVFLTSSRRDLPARQQTLRNAVDWSFHLLDTEAQALLSRLTVFVGGWTLAAVEAICCVADQYVLDIAATMTRLVSASLVQQHILPNDEFRFTMLETIREYALEQFSVRRERHLVQHQHARYYLVLAEKAEPLLQGGAQQQWLQRLERDYENFRVALRWGLEAGEIVLAAHLGAALWRFWYIQGHLIEGSYWLAQVLACPALPDNIRVRVLNGAGLLAFLQDSYGSARAAFEEGLGLLHGQEDDDTHAQLLTHLGLVALWQAEHSRAIALLQEGLRLSQQINDSHGMAMILNNLGLAFLGNGDTQYALELMQEAYRQFAALEQPQGMGLALNFQGRALLMQGDTNSSATLFDESLLVLEPLGNVPGIARSHVYLAYTALEAQEIIQAQGHLRQSLHLFRMIGDREGIATALEGFVEVERQHEQYTNAVQFIGAAAALRETISASTAYPTRAIYERYVMQIRAAMGHDYFAMLWTIGYRQKLEVVIVAALEQRYLPTPQIGASIPGSDACLLAQERGMTSS